MFKLFIGFLALCAVIAAMVYYYLRKTSRRTGRQILEQEMQWYESNVENDNEPVQNI
jgi:uncharacterized membrane protein YciS (DUF1049 family)